MGTTVKSDIEPVNKQFSVNWSNHMNHVRSAFHALFATRELVDVTLYCEGRKTGAHKMLLSACSTYFREVFRDNPCKHPVIILEGVQFEILQDILNFMYNGEVSIDSNNFDSFIKTAQLLQVSGLTESAALSENSVQCTNESLKDANQNAGSNSEKLYQEDNLHEEHDEEYMSDVKEPALKKRKALSKVSNIKCESEDVMTEEHSYDALQEEAIHEGTAGDEENTMDDAYASQVFKDSKGNFVENLYVASDSVSSTPMRQSAFSESSLKCTVCEKVFSHPYSLHHHKAVHSGSTECPICHAVLSRKYNLKIHMKARHHV